MAGKFYLLLCISVISQPLAADVGSAHDAAPAAIADLRSLIAGTVNRFEQHSLQDWSYRISRYENEEGDISSRQELFDPTQAPGRQWQLLRLNGQTPDTKQLRRYAADKQKQVTKANQHSFSLKLSKLIQLDSLTLVAEDPYRLEASFKVYIKKLGAEASKALQGQLSFDKTKQYIDSIQITNNAGFSPLLGSRIDHFNLTLQFMQIDGVMLPQQQTMTMKGTFAYFTGIDEVSTVTFSDYRYIANETLTLVP